MIGTHKTNVRESGSGNIVVQYHATNVVEVENGIVRLNSGGWHTATTKKRMNQASQEFNLGFAVYQKQREWFVEFGGETLEYFDGMTLDTRGMRDHLHAI